MSEPKQTNKISATLKVVMTDHGRGDVWLDGKRINGVTGVDVSVDCDDTNRFTLRGIAHAVEVDGMFETTGFESECRESRKAPESQAERMAKYLTKFGKDGIKHLEFDLFRRRRFQRACNRVWFVQRASWKLKKIQNPFRKPFRGD